MSQCHAIQAFDRRRHRLGCLIVTDTFPRKNQARPEKNLLQNRHERRGIKLPDIAILQNHRKTPRNRGKIDDGCRIHCHRLQRGSRVSRCLRHPAVKSILNDTRCLAHIRCLLHALLHTERCRLRDRIAL